MADKTFITKIKSYFSPAATRENLTSGEELQTSLGKVKKWLSDLGTAAFTNSTDYAAASHNQPSSTITAMTGYSKPQATSAITASDTLNEAIGKLEKGLDGAGGGLQPGNVDVSTNSVTLTSSSPTATVTISNITGEPSLVVIGQNFSATLNNGVITITRTGSWAETGEILVSIAGNSTYSPAVAIITVTVDGVELVTWSEGTPTQIEKMIKAAHNGDLNLADYWSVGDTKTLDGKTYVLQSGISYKDSNETVCNSTFKVIWDLNVSSVSIPKRKINCGNLLNPVYRYRAYAKEPNGYNDFLYSCALSFLSSHNSIKTSDKSATSENYTTKSWYGNIEDFRYFFPSAGNYGPYIYSTTNDNIPNDPAYSSVSSYETVAATVQGVYRISSSGSSTYTSTYTGSSANPSVVSNMGIIAYVLI